MKNLVIGVIFTLLGISTAYCWNLLKTEKKLPLIINSPPAKTSFSLEVAPRDSLRGSISTISGNVFWLSRTATEASLLLNPVYLQQGEAIIASDTGHITVSFENNILNLLPKTEVDIIQTLPNSLVFNQKSGTASYSGSLSVRALHIVCDVNGESSIKISDDVINIKVATGSATVAYNDLSYTSHVISVKDSLIFEDNLRRVLK